jgi:uncharacterized protein (TIGR03083 family)
MVTLEEMVDTFDATGDQFVEQLYRLSPADGELSVPGMKWTVVEVAAHMLAVVRRGVGDRRRSDTVEGLADLNDLTAAEIDSRLPAELADRIMETKSVLSGALRAQTDEQAQATAFPLHAGLIAAVPTALSYVVFDFIVHGQDIARATGRKWTIDPAHAALCLKAGMAALRPWICEDAVAGAAQKLVFTFPASEHATVIEVGEGTYRAHNLPRAEVVDAAEVDPVEALLAVAGRVEATDATLRRLASWFRPI